MDEKKAKELIINTLEGTFNKENFKTFLKNLLKVYSEEATFHNKGNFIPDAYKNYVSSLERVGKYTYDNKEIDLLIVTLKKETSLERARTLQRNFIAWYLKGSRGGKLKDAALVAFVSANTDDWRFSFIKIDYRIEVNNSKAQSIEELSPARRWSFIVGKNEKSHTAQSMFLPFLIDDSRKPTIEDLEKAFNVEIVTDEFFEKYRDLFIKTKLELDNVAKNDNNIEDEFKEKNINTVDFAKKLLGQIIFLYFLQKKGWFGVEKDQTWGTGKKDFIRKLFNKEFVNYNNFFNDILEPLFYEALTTDRSNADHYYSRFNCKIPFLNGGLFDPINSYNWVETEILISNELFSNTNKTKEGDIGDGILDVFDRYNFTINEDEPLEKEVALDPELLGKIYEKLNAINSENFDEYLSILESGKKSDETKFNRKNGVFYTPRDIVHYMCQQSLINYLETELVKIIPHSSNIKEDIELFVKLSDIAHENEETSIAKENKIKNGEIKSSSYNSKVPEIIRNNATEIDNLLSEIKVCDPACGSGAFPIGMMHEIVKLRKLLALYVNKSINTYDLKRHCIENSLYGVDIDLGAVEVCKLRFWLSMVVDEEDFYSIKPLPNLDYKVVCGDSILGFPKDYKCQKSQEIEELQKQFFSETNPKKKKELKTEIDKKLNDLLNQSHCILGFNINFDFRLFFPNIFIEKGGFDIVIGNPPYVSTKDVNADYKKKLTHRYGFADDLYSHFYFKGIELLKESGFLCFISSKTFWTIQTKKNLRNLILENKLLLLFDTANPFDAPMVDTCVILIQKCSNPPKNYMFQYLDGSKSITEPVVKDGNIEYYKNAPNQVFFPINDYNLRIYERYGKKVNELLNQWWDKIFNSKKIEKNKKELEKYRASLQPGDITLLGLITEGGQGLATANNGKYIGVKEGTKWAKNVKKQRPEKLLLAKEFCKQNNVKNKDDAGTFLNNLNELEIRKLFDDIKEKYGRDVFGQGWLYRIVSENEISDVDSLNNDEKLNGIDGERTFVPYDKGDKDGNRWYAPTPYYIDWSRENVNILQTDPKARWQGYQFYFREGFCWTFTLNEYSELFKTRVRPKSVFDVNAMSLFSLISEVPVLYLVCLLNSYLIFYFKKTFINSTSGFQINDARQLPIIIPNSDQLRFFENIFNRAVAIQKDKFSKKISEKEAEKELKQIQKELDKFVEEMYLC